MLLNTAFSVAADNPIKVDRSNYQEAEVARNFSKWAAKGANNIYMAFICQGINHSNRLEKMK
jgi:hypothetical protein